MAKNLLTENIDKLHTMADALMEFETLSRPARYTMAGGNPVILLSRHPPGSVPRMRSRDHRLAARGRGRRSDLPLITPAARASLRRQDAIVGNTAVDGRTQHHPRLFSDGGTFQSGSVALDAVREQAIAMVESGAKILDIGGESSRPGAQVVSPAEEQRRVLPVLEALQT